MDLLLIKYIQGSAVVNVRILPEPKANECCMVITVLGEVKFWRICSMQSAVK